jgi:transcriptional regulator of acetoin/glycerol metabolism
MFPPAQQLPLPTSQDALRHALQLLLEDRVVPSGMVSPSVLDSWRRSRQWGLLPDESWRVDGSEPSPADASRALDANQALLALTKSRLEALHGSLPGRDGLVALCIAPDGCVLHSVGRPGEVHPLFRAARQVGRSVRELDIGTNAAGCALMDERPRVVARGEHYLRGLSALACAAVPFHGPDGELAGLLDLTGVDVSIEPTAVQRLVGTARLLENDLLIQRPDRVLFQVNDDPRLAGSALEGLVSLDEATQTCWLNAAARRLFGLDDADSGGVEAGKLFGRTEWHHMLATSKQRRTLALRERRGYLLHVTRMGRRAVREDVDVAGANEASPAAVLRIRSRGALPIDNEPRIADLVGTGVRAIERGVPLILEGESGTGKEVMAQQIHRQSSRAGKRLVAIDCAAIPEGLIEAELFGYVDGAFTGGRRGGSPGVIRQAHGGTLFLDEIGDMPLTLQTRLLRVLQERHVTPVGGLQPVPVEFALICATHRNLSQAVAEGRFRADLFHRINGLLLRLPPLRERQDLKHLIQDFLLEYGEGGEPIGLDDEVYALFASYSWPGNIRQLRNAVRAAAVLADDAPTIGLAHLPESLQHELGLSGARDTPVRGAALALAEREAIRRALDSVDGNVTRAAASLSMSRSTLHRRLHSLGLR